MQERLELLEKKLRLSLWMIRFLSMFVILLEASRADTNWALVAPAAAMGLVFALVGRVHDSRALSGLGTRSAEGDR